MAIYNRSMFTTVAVLLLTAGAILTGCNNSPVVPQADYDAIEGEWTLERSCGGCLNDCSYPNYRGETRAVFVNGGFQVFRDSTVINRGSYECTGELEDWTLCYALIVEGETGTNAAFLTPERELRIAGSWGIPTQYYIPF